jgi:hypothetical protein
MPIDAPPEPENDTDRLTDVCPKCKGLGGYPRCPECLNSLIAKRPSPNAEFRGPIEQHEGMIRVRVDVQREGSMFWARAVADPTRPEVMPLASGPTRELAIFAACEKASMKDAT